MKTPNSIVIRVNSFNKDSNYFRFKKYYQRAIEDLRIARLYLEDNRLIDVHENVDASLNSMGLIEFED